MPENLFLMKQSLLQHLVFEFGSSVGFGLSAILLAIFGFILSWKSKQRLVYVYSAAFILIILSKFFFFMPIYLNLIVVVSAAFAFSELLKSKWSLKSLKTVAIIAVICTFLFSAVSFAFVIKDMQPDKRVVESLLSLRKEPYGAVFSHPDRGFWIKYYSAKPVFADTLTLSNELQNKTELLYYSRNYANSTQILNESSIKYIWIDEEMKQGQVWSKPDQGLLFLFVDKDLFDRIYKDKELETWEYLGIK
jgi:hypothetical protein